MKDPTSQEHDQLQECVPPGWVVESATWDPAGQRPRIIVRLRRRRLAPIVQPDAETPTVEPEEPTIVEGSGTVRTDAIKEACDQMRSLP